MVLLKKIDIRKSLDPTAAALHMREPWALYAEAFRTSQASSRANLGGRNIFLWSAVGFAFAIYLMAVIMPKAKMPALQIEFLAAYLCFAFVTYVITLVGSHPLWHLASMVHWFVFALFLEINLGFALILRHSPEQAIFWSVWIFVLFVEGAIVFGSRRAIIFLAVPLILHATTVAVYFSHFAQFRPVFDADDMLLGCLVAQIIALNLIYVLITVRDHHASSLASAEALVAETRETAERRRVEGELIETQLELEQVSRKLTMSALAASLAHEINQPLAALVTNAEAGLRWLSEADPNVDEARTVLSRIVREGNRAAAVIASVRSLLKKRETAHQLVDINQCAMDVLRLFHIEMDRRSIQARMQLAEHLRHVYGDRIQLQQLFINLVKNAIESMDTVSHERLLTLTTCQRTDGRVGVVVSDSGTGICDDVAVHIFDAFFTTKQEGMGMGLAICKSIVDAHGGELSMNSSPQGSEFHIVLPSADKDR